MVDQPRQASAPHSASHTGLQVVRAKAASAIVSKPCVYVLDSNLKLLEYIRRTLGSHYDFHLFSAAASFVSAFEQAKNVDLVLCSWDQQAESLEVMQAMRRYDSQVPLIVLCCSAEITDYQAFAGLGAASILLKPFVAETLHAEMRKYLPEPEDPEATKEIVLDGTHSFVRANKQMREIERQASLVAKSDIPVLILGESGTGKEILAMFVHKMSNRKERIFLKINCAAMPAELLESELFGYEQGAFTGALRTKPGKFETCNGGTIFLDEIGEMPAPLQAKLLQVLQDGTYSRLGSRTSMKTDVRVVSATNVNMKQSIANGAFREDLYYRLNGLSIKLPPLRERLDELPSLIRYFVRKGADRFGLEPMPMSLGLLTAFLHYHWPGNLRELENVINRLLVLRDERAVLAELHTEPMTEPDFAEFANGGPGKRNVRSIAGSLRGDAEAAAIASVLEQTRWNRRAAADHLQINYKTLLYKIKQYELTPKSA